MNANTALDALKQRIQPLKGKLDAIPGLAPMFERCFLSTVETTMKETPEGNTFVITGDIPALWLRDSTAQVLHYLRYADNEAVRQLILGLIRTHIWAILYDPYANAFNQKDGQSWDPDDFPKARPRVWERKYEIDSLCYPVLLMRRYTEKTGDTGWLTGDAIQAFREILRVLRTEQKRETSGYRFIRPGASPTDTLSHGGVGAPVGYTGMVWSGFRPSDDACRYGYLVPANLFAKTILPYIAAFAETKGETALKEDALKLAAEIGRGVRDFAVVNHPVFGDVLAYETDGLGHHLLMDDANVPSLLSLPYLGACEKDDPLYLNTRRLILSRENPCYAEGRFAKGIGSPHTPPGYIWHIALCVQAMTAVDEDEIAALLHMLLTTHAGTQAMHEGFDPDDPAQFTRAWFAWANSMFAETVLRLHEEGRLEAVLARVQEKG